MLNKELRTAVKKWSSSLELVVRLKALDRNSVTEFHKEAS